MGTEAARARWTERIAIDSEVMGGKPVIKGTRVPVETIIGSLAGGDTMDVVCEGYRITEEDVRAALAYAAEMLSQERLHALPGG
jgi:uncharacterized protein (DUF433 family)